MKVNTMKSILLVVELLILGLCVFFFRSSVHGDETNEKQKLITQQGFEVPLNEPLSPPEFPKNIDLTPEFRLAQHFQDFSIIYYADSYIGESVRIGKAIDENDKIVISLLKKQDVISIINEIRPYWKTKWKVELPLWPKNYRLWYYRLIQHAIYENKISPDIGNQLGIPPLESDMEAYKGAGMHPMHNSVFGSDASDMPPTDTFESMGAFGDTKKRNDEPEKVLYLGDAIYVKSDFFPRPQHAVFITETGGFLEKIYLVACYQCLDEKAYQKEELDGDSVRLRYLFMGCQPKKLYQGGSLYHPITKWLSPNFSPTGSIMIFDEEGHPRRYYSVKEGKFFGPQIQWDIEGKIVEFEDMTKPGKSCKDIWLEFTRK